MLPLTVTKFNIMNLKVWIAMVVVKQPMLICMWQDGWLQPEEMDADAREQLEQVGHIHHL